MSYGAITSFLAAQSEVISFLASPLDAIWCILLVLRLLPLMACDAIISFTAANSDGI